MLDLYQEITDRIIAELEQGVIPWQKPWSATQGAISHTTGKRYSLLNQIMLGCRSGEFITYREAEKEGGHIRKGEKSSMIVFWKFIPTMKKDLAGNIVLDKDGKPVVEDIPFLRYYNVFHIDQCEGIKQRYKVEENKDEELKPFEAAEKIVDGYITRTGIKLNRIASSRAFYSPMLDSVTVPLLKQFTDLSEYYGTLFHELTHSTGHPSRLNRLKLGATFGSEPYSKEELVAELGSAFLVNHVGLETTASFKNSASYIQSWLKVLQDDKKMIVSAAGKADKAVSLILGEPKNTTV